MLEFSCADYTFPLLGRGESLALIHLLQFDFVDIGLFERSPSFLPSDLVASPRQFTDTVRKDLDAASLRPADVFLQVGTDPDQMSANDPDKRVRLVARDTFCRALDFCSAIDCTHMTGLPGIFHTEPSRDLAKAAEESRWRMDIAAKAGVTYSIEPHVGSVCPTVKATLEFLARVRGLTLTLDYGHFLFQGEPNAVIHSLLPHASHLHLRGSGPGRLQTSASESAVDLRHIVESLSTGYKGRVAFEYVWSDWHDCNRTDNLSETILLRRQVVELQVNLKAEGPKHV